MISGREVTEDGRGSDGNEDNTERSLGENGRHLWAGGLHGREFRKINGLSQKERLNRGDRQGRRG